MKIFILALLLINLNYAVDLSEIELTEDELNKLVTSKSSESIIHKFVTKFKNFIKALKEKIVIHPNEYVRTMFLKDKVLSDTCDLTINSTHNKGTSNLLKSSFLEINTKYHWDNIQIIGEFGLDTKLNLSSAMYATLGKSMIGKCFHYYDKLSAVYMENNGKAKLGLELKVELEDIYRKQGTWYLEISFDLHFLESYIDIDVENIVLSGCTMYLFGHIIYDFCPKIEKYAKNHINEAYNKITHVLIPNLIQKLEKKLNFKTKKTFVIPIKLIKKESAVEI